MANAVKTRKRAGAVPRVAVLVDTSTTWGRRIIVGVHHYAQKHGPWQIRVDARGWEEHLAVPAGWEVDGVIAQVATPRVARELNALGTPVVNVSGVCLPGAHFPRVCTDMGACARLAVAHFLEKGFPNLAYFGLHPLSYVSAQETVFRDLVSQARRPCASLTVGTHAGAEPGWRLDLNRLAEWLRGLARPVAVFTWNVSSAREILYGCQTAGLLVPEEVAVLSGSEDDLLCEVSDIPISAILHSSEQIGARAAEVLDQWMQGLRLPRLPLLIPPIRIIQRLSTETLAVEDPALVRALSFIRENTTRPIQVAEVARQAGLSRRVLERRFAALLGRSPAEEIRELHFQRASQLLMETDLPIPDVAESAGFGSPEYLAYVFRRRLACTPLRYRRDIRGR
jgi:LacI family transcriptional regulator